MLAKFIFHASRRMISLVLIVAVAFSPTFSYAQSAFVSALPEPGTMVMTSDAFVPVLVKGLVIHPDKPLNFDFIVDSGNDSPDQAVVKEQGQKMAQYFLAAITVPEDQLWVNLSPYEKDRVIENELGQTVLGRDMLAQDYILKQLTSSLIYPEKGLGKEFWARVYAEAQAKFGTTDVPVDAFNKVWIMPEKAEVFEKGNAVYVADAKLKVMLDSDRTAMTQNVSDAVTDEKAVVAKAVMREIVVPAIEKEVNEGKNFSAIRQVYHAAILAKWYRELIQNTLLADAYVGKNKVSGVTTDEKVLKEEIYQRYIAAYKKGVFNYIKEEVAATGETLPRKYFSGGEQFSKIPITRAKNATALGHKVGQLSKIDFAMNRVQDSAMTPKMFIGMGGISAVTQVADWYQNLSTVEAVGLWAGVAAAAGFVGYGVYQRKYLKISLLRRMPNQVGLDGLLRMLNDNDFDVRHAVSRAIENYQDSRSLGKIIRLLNDSNAQKRNYFLSAFSAGTSYYDLLAKLFPQQMQVIPRAEMRDVFESQPYEREETFIETYYVSGGAQGGIPVEYEGTRIVSGYEDVKVGEKKVIVTEYKNIFGETFHRSVVDAAQLSDSFNELLDALRNGPDWLSHDVAAKLSTFLDGHSLETVVGILNDVDAKVREQAMSAFATWLVQEDYFRLLAGVSGGRVTIETGSEEVQREGVEWVEYMASSGGTGPLLSSYPVPTYNNVKVNYVRIKNSFGEVIRNIESDAAQTTAITVPQEEQYAVMPAFRKSIDTERVELLLKQGSVDRSLIKDARVVAFLDLLKRHNLNDIIVFGGAVRDVILGGETKDVDITVRVDWKGTLDQITSGRFEANLLPAYKKADMLLGQLAAVLGVSKERFFDLSNLPTYQGIKINYSGPVVIDGEKGKGFVGRFLLDDSTGRMITDISTPELLLMGMDSTGRLYEYQSALKNLLDGRIALKLDRLGGRVVWKTALLRLLGMRHQFGLGLTQADIVRIKRIMTESPRSSQNPREQITAEVRKVLESSADIGLAKQELKELGFEVPVDFAQSGTDDGLKEFYKLYDEYQRLLDEKLGPYSNFGQWDETSIDSGNDGSGFEIFKQYGTVNITVIELGRVTEEVTGAPPYDSPFMGPTVSYGNKTVRHVSIEFSPPDKAQGSVVENTGGVDIQNIDVVHKNGSAKIKFNDQVVRDVLKNGFNGFTPVVINMTPIESPLMIMGASQPEAQSVHT
ncbi:MAG: hypothetical protein HQL22_10745 [Candidatus Omnitrophica bacterium]|nr:hypothetical protein [Candidatus Omnitrophota bacterium]